jgi:hypothetical protein
MDKSYIEYFNKLNGEKNCFQKALFYGYQGFGVPKHLRMDTIPLETIKDACEKGEWRAADENPWIYPVERNTHWLKTFFEPGIQRLPSEHAIGLGPVEDRPIPPMLQLLPTKKMVEPWVVPTLKPTVVPLQAIDECEEFPERPRLRRYTKFRSPRLPKLPAGWHEVQEIEPILGQVTYFTYLYSNEGLTYQFQTRNYPKVPVPVAEYLALGRVWDQLPQKTVAQVVASIPNFTVPEFPVYKSYDLKKYWFDPHKRIIKWVPEDPRARMNDGLEWPLVVPEDAVKDPEGFPCIKPETAKTRVVEYETEEWVKRVHLKTGVLYWVNLRTSESKICPVEEQPKKITPVPVPVPEPIPEDPRAALDSYKHRKFPLTYPEDVLLGSDGLPILVPWETGNDWVYASCYNVWTHHEREGGGLWYRNMLTEEALLEPPVMYDPRAKWNDGLYWPEKYPPIVKLGLEDQLPVIASRENKRVVYEAPKTVMDPRWVSGDGLIWPSECSTRLGRPRMGHDGFPLISVNDKGMVYYTWPGKEEVDELPPPENSPVPLIPGPPGRGPEILTLNETIEPEVRGRPDVHWKNLMRTKAQLKANLGREPTGVEIQDSLYMQYLDRLQMVKATANGSVKHGWDVEGGLLGTMDPVPPGWTLYFSVVNGQPCYFHQYSGRAQHKKPVWPKCSPKPATPEKKVLPVEVEDSTNSEEKQANRAELVKMSKAMLFEFGPDNKQEFFRMSATLAPANLPAVVEEPDEEDLGPAPPIPPLSLDFLMAQKAAGQQVPDYLVESCKKRERSLSAAQLKAEASAREYFEKRAARDQRLNARIEKLKAAEPPNWRVPSTLLSKMAETQFYTNLELLEMSTFYDKDLSSEEQAEEDMYYYAFAQSQVRLFDLLAQQAAQEALLAAEEAANPASSTLSMPPRQMKGDPSRLIGSPPESTGPRDLPFFEEDAQIYNDLAQIAPPEFLEQYDVFEYKPLLDRLMERRNSEDNAGGLPPPPPLEVVNGEVVLPAAREVPSPTSMLRMTRAQNELDHLHEVKLEDLLTPTKKVELGEPVPKVPDPYEYRSAHVSPATRRVAQLHQLPPPKLPSPPPSPKVTAFRHPILTAAQRAQMEETQRAELAAATPGAPPPIVAEPPPAKPSTEVPLAADGSRSAFFRKWRQVPGNQGNFEGAVLGNFLRDFAFMGISHQFISWLQNYPDCTDPGVGFQLDLDLYDQQHSVEYVPPPLMKIQIAKQSPRSPKFFPELAVEKTPSPPRKYPGANAFERAMNAQEARIAQEKKEAAKQRRLEKNPPKASGKRRTSGSGPSATRRKYN